MLSPMLDRLKPSRLREHYPYGSDTGENVDNGVWPYDLTREERYAPHVDRLVNMVQDGAVDYEPPLTLLDIGPGNGTGAREVRDVVSYFVEEDVEAVVVDPNEQVLGKQDGETVPVQGVVQDLPLQDGYADVVLCFGMFPYIATETPEAQAEGLNEIQRVLSPGGVAAVQYFRDPRKDVELWDNRYRFTDSLLFTYDALTEMQEETGGFSDYPLTAPDAARDGKRTSGYTALHDHHTRLGSGVSQLIGATQEYFGGAAGIEE